MSDDLSKNIAIIKATNMRKQLGMNLEWASISEDKNSLKKGKAVAIGTRRTHADGITRMKTATGWTPVKGGATSEPKKPASTDVKGLAGVHKLLSEGHTDVQTIVDATGADRSDVVVEMSKKGITPGPSAEGVSKPKLAKPDVKTRWSAYRTFLDMVAGGLTKAAIAYGTGGVGKTYNLKQVFEKRGLEEYDLDKHVSGMPTYDYIKITGKATPTAMYKALYEHNGKIVVFDDCDSVLKDETCVNILKGALDTTGDGTVSYLSGKPIKDSDGVALPQSFKFQGRAVFVSNLDTEEMPQPLRSRSLTIDLTMTAKETMVMLKEIVHKMPFQDYKGNPIEVSHEDRADAVDFLDSIHDSVNIGDLNARTLGQIALIKKKMAGTSEDWKMVAQSMLT